MSALSRILRRSVKKGLNRVMDKVGGRMVSGMADTSSDAPSAAFAPKRNLYAQLQAEEEQARSERKAAREAASADAPAADEHSHDHDHGHSHDHGRG